MKFGYELQALDRQLQKQKEVTLNLNRIIMQQSLTAIIEKEDNMYVSLCPELDIASQGNSIEEAKANLQEAIELFFETASGTEISHRLHNDIFITRLNVEVG